MSWLIGLGSMTIAVLANSLTGPAFKYIENHHIKPSLAAAWRGHCMVFFLFPIAYIEYLQTGKSIQYFDRKPDLPYPVYVHVLFGGLGWSGTLLFWINGLNFLSTVRASLFVNLHPLLMVFYLYFTGVQLCIYDWCGVFFALSGLVVMSSDELYNEFMNQTDETHSVTSQIIGAILCILAACCEFAVIINRKKIKKYVPLMQYTAITTFVVTLIASIYSLLMEHTTLIETSPTRTFLFGWTAPFWRLKLIFFGILNGVLCQAGFNFAMQYIDALLFSSLLLVSTPTTGFLSWLFGIEGIPDKFTIIGGSILLFGIGLITYSEHKRHQIIQNNVNPHQELEDNENNSIKRTLPTSPLSIASLIQMTPPLQYNRLEQVDVDEEEQQSQS